MKEEEEDEEKQPLPYSHWEIYSKHVIENNIQEAAERGHSHRVSTRLQMSTICWYYTSSSSAGAHLFNNLATR